MIRYDYGEKGRRGISCANAFTPDQTGVWLFITQEERIDCLGSTNITPDVEADMYCPYAAIEGRVICYDYIGPGGGVRAVS